MKYPLPNFVLEYNNLTSFIMTDMNYIHLCIIWKYSNTDFSTHVE